ncbi:SHOCT domain-containing protein [Phenylobacterium sp.]|uniref:SHOCT domain-containing protein n=1 Tax=Phenylobacterium sp. TaxID=1871053 RepID=UPI0025F8E4BE|nr:SHOCT domain-containing protein [Phenylobacterium sp.]
MTETQPPLLSPPPVGSGPRAQLQTLLVPGEALVAHALQHRVYALLHRRDVAAATTTRFIFMTRPLLGGYQPVDVRWQDLKDVEITVGMFSARVTLTFNTNLSDTAAGDGAVETLRASGLTIEAAQALYRESQAQELAWREKRRVRTMEEMRAQAGGVQIATGVYPQAVGGEVSHASGPDAPRLAGASAADDPVERLARARAMLQQGLITDAEYEAIKARVVGAL